MDDRIVSGLQASRSGLAVAGNRAVDQARVQRPHRLVAESQFVETSGLEVFDEDVGLRQQGTQVGRALRVLEVEPDAPLAAIDADEIGAPRAHEWRPAAGVVAFGRFFDLDDVGAHVAEEHGAERTGEDTREVDDPEAF